MLKNNNIVGNKIGPEGAKEIAATLEENNTITTIDLGCKLIKLKIKNNKYCRE